ncbi:MAG: DUF4062 domain-containing protein [Prevotella sp.]|nr:DUF4062 domain-containing protein [Prevotella sp.]
MNRIKIFISSVQSEFAEEPQMLRNYISTDALLGSFFDVFIFEDMPAYEDTVQKVYLREVADCDERALFPARRHFQAHHLEGGREGWSPYPIQQCQYHVSNNDSNNVTDNVSSYADNVSNNVSSIDIQITLTILSSVDRKPSPRKELLLAVNLTNQTYNIKRFWEPFIADSLIRPVAHLTKHQKKPLLSITGKGLKYLNWLKQQQS